MADSPGTLGKPLDQPFLEFLSAVAKQQQQQPKENSCAAAKASTCHLCRRQLPRRKTDAFTQTNPVPDRTGDWVAATAGGEATGPPQLDDPLLASPPSLSNDVTVKRIRHLLMKDRAKLLDQATGMHLAALPQCLRSRIPATPVALCRFTLLLLVHYPINAVRPGSKPSIANGDNSDCREAIISAMEQRMRPDGSGSTGGETLWEGCIQLGSLARDRHERGKNTPQGCETVEGSGSNQTNPSPYVTVADALVSARQASRELNFGVDFYGLLHEHFPATMLPQ